MKKAAPTQTETRASASVLQTLRGLPGAEDDLNEVTMAPQATKGDKVAPTDVPKRIVIGAHYLPGLPLLRFNPGYPTYLNLPGTVGVYEIKMTIPRPPAEVRCGSVQTRCRT